MARVYNFPSRIGKVLGVTTCDFFYYFRIFPQLSLRSGLLHAHRCMSQFYTSHCSCSVKGAGSYYYTPPRHFHFLWFLRFLILCFVPFQIMCFSYLFLCCSNFSFVVILKIVLKNNNKIYTHLWRLIMILATYYKYASVRIPEVLSQVCCHGLLINQQRIEVLIAFICWNREIGSTGQIN